MNVKLSILIRLLCLSWCSAFSIFSDIFSELPCHFHDSINITDGTLQSNNSLTFNGIDFPENQYAEVNYILENEDDYVEVQPHIRGCLCNRKPCIRLCCPFGSITQNKNEHGNCYPHEAAKNLEAQILDENNELKNVRFDQHFSFVDKIPCQQAYVVDDDEYRITHVSEPFN